MNPVINLSLNGQSTKEDVERVVAAIRPTLTLKRDPVRYRAVLVITGMDVGGDHWLVQEQRTFWRFRWWHDLRALRSRDEAQELVDRLQYEGIVTPSRERA